MIITSSVRQILKNRRSCILLSVTGKRDMTNVVRPLFLHLFEKNYNEKTAIQDRYGKHSYNELLSYSKTLSNHILYHAQQNDKITKNSRSLLGQHVAFLSSNTVNYSIMQFAIWMSGGVAVPLGRAHPENELHYTIQDSESYLVLSDAEHTEKISPVLKELNVGSIIVNTTGYFKTEDAKFDNFIYHQNEDKKLQKFSSEFHDTWKDIDWEDKNALIIYTSGTTGRPKGVVLSFLNLQTQMNAITKAWEISHFDTTLHALPLHHVHGIVNVLACSLWVGGTCVMLDSFSPKMVWKQLIGGNNIDVFHGVPTMYALLIKYYESLHELSKEKTTIRNTLRSKLRLMVSGSAPLPKTILTKWKEISGHTLLERYGMSEVGMVLTNPLHGKRVPGAVGKPFPSVEIKIVAVDGQDILRGDDKHLDVLNNTILPGDLYVRGPSVFKQYLNRPEATEESFTKDGWFKTGDTAIYDESEDVIRIMGRTSVDIIKSGGFKISALDVEAILNEHPSVQEVIVVGLEDEAWGQIVAAISVFNPQSPHLTLTELQLWSENKLPLYAIPRKLMVLNSIPRNAMGKVNKKQLVLDHFVAH